jgi:hypothetical protein
MQAARSNVSQGHPAVTIHNSPSITNTLPAWPLTIGEWREDVEYLMFCCIAW